MAPRVSVLLPVRDGAPTLDQCLASLRAQTLGDFEVVAVDDGSLDATGELLRRAARADRRIRVLARGRDGLAAALNAGLAAAQAPLLARLDADDVCAPERLRLQAERLEADPAVDVLACRVSLLADGIRDNAGMRAHVDWMNGLLDHEAIVGDLYVESPLAHPSVMMRTAALRALSGYRAFDGPEDYDLWLRAHAAGLRFARLPEVLLQWRDRPGRLTRTDPRYAPARFRELKVVALERGALRGAPPVVIWGAGPIGKRWARTLVARGHDVRALVDVHPRRIGARIAGAPVIALEAVDGVGPAVHLAAVGQPGARERIRALAAAKGLLVIAVA